MDTRAFVLSVTLGGVIGVADIAAGQHEGHQAGGAATPPAAQGAECRQAQPVIIGLLNAAIKRLEDARLTNSAAAMRDATDDVQAALVDVRAQLAPCSVMQPATADAPPARPAATPPSADRTGSPTAQPGPSLAAPAGAGAHAGHAMPAAPQSPASGAPAAAPARTPSTPQRPAAPAAADAHAGHTTPAAPASRAPSAPTTRPSAAQSKAPASAAHADQATPVTARRTAAAAPPTVLADLKCSNAVDPRTAPRMLYQGRMYYFCTDASRAEFAKDPTKFVTAPRQAAPAHAH